MEKKVFFNTTVPENLIKEFKILAIRLSKRQNELLVEAIQDLLKVLDQFIRGHVFDVLFSHFFNVNIHGSTSQEKTSKTSPRP